MNDLEATKVDDLPTKNEKPRLWSKFKKIFIWTCASILVLYLLILSFFATTQTLLLYPATKEKLPKPIDLNFAWRHQQTAKNYSEIGKWERVEIKTEDSETLVCFWLDFPNVTDEEPFTMIHFHGNAGHIGHRLDIHMGFRNAHMYYRVLLVGYRGYGESTGTPSEEGFKKDSQAALDWTLKRLNEEDRKRLVVYGQSMGGAVAIDLAANNPGKFKYLIVENTFLSIPKLVPEISFLLYPAVPFIHQIWNSEEAIKKVQQNTLFISAEEDEIISPAHMRTLHEAATCTKSFLKIAKAHHNDAFMFVDYVHGMRKFILESFERDRLEKLTPS